MSRSAATIVVLSGLIGRASQPRYVGVWVGMSFGEAHAVLSQAGAVPERTALYDTNLDEPFAYALPDGSILLMAVHKQLRFITRMWHCANPDQPVMLREEREVGFIRIRSK